MQIWTINAYVTDRLAIILNLRDPEATKLYREYWKLMGLDKLNTTYTKRQMAKYGDFGNYTNN
jgi:hypothetical protein